MITRYKYDVAISVAAEDLSVAELIAASFRKAGISYYLYTEHTTEHIGKTLLRITLDTYGKQARFILMITSKHFVNKYWPGIEQQVVQLYSRRPESSILQLKLDDTSVDGLSKYKIHLVWHGNPGDISLAIKVKLEHTKRRRRTWNISILALALTAGIGCYFSSGSSDFKKARYIRGVVNIGGVPVANLEVYTPYSKSTTDSLGKYKIDLSACNDCKPGHDVRLYTYHPQYGSSVKDLTLPANGMLDFQIENNPKNIYVNGMAIDKDTRLPLSGVGIKIIGGDFSIEETTDNSGLFRVGITKAQTERINAARFQVFDPRGLYSPVENGTRVCMLNDFNMLEMRRNNVNGEVQTYQFRVKNLLKTNVRIESGDHVTIVATGLIDVGGLYGKIGPAGLDISVLASVDNIISGYKHAALMYRLEDDGQWFYSGEKTDFIAVTDGKLSFNVNDNNQGNNNGYYEVKVVLTNSNR